MSRAALVWLVLFAAFAATLAVGGDRTQDEPHLLLTAESIVSDGDIDVRDELSTGAYADWHDGTLERQGQLTGGRAHEPHGLGFPLLIAPAYWLAGPTGAALLVAAFAALAFALALALARRVVPEPYATGAVLAAGLSPPALAYGAAVDPELVAGALLAGAALLALRVRETGRAAPAYAAGALLAVLPWLSTLYLIPALPVAAALVRWTARRGRTVRAWFVAEIMAGSLVVFATLNEVLYGGWTPHAADLPGETATDEPFPGGYVDRLPRLAALWIDRVDGLLRWAPVFALAFVGLFALWRSRADRVARAVPERRDAEVAAALAALVGGAVVLAAALGTTALGGEWFPARHLVAGLPLATVLVAWGLRRLPRAGAALGALTIAATAWLVVDLARGAAAGWARPEGSEVPFWVLTGSLPRFGTGDAWPAVAGWTLFAALLALVAYEWRRARIRAA